MYYGFYYDWTYILVLIGVVLSLLASSQRNICKIFEDPQLFRDDRTRSGRTDSQKKWNL